MPTYAFRHPLPILNISEHLTRLKLQTRSSNPFGTIGYCSNISGTCTTDRDYAVIGALLGTQNGRDVEIVNTFELAASEDGSTVDQDFLLDRKEQCTTIIASLDSARVLTRPTDKQVFPSLEFIGWYTVAARPTAQHIALHEQASDHGSSLHSA